MGRRVVVGSDLELSGERLATRGYGEVEGDFPGDAVKRIKDITGYRRDPTTASLGLRRTEHSGTGRPCVLQGRWSKESGSV